jgi:hypothetical protein
MLKKLFSGLFGSDRQAAAGTTTKAADAVEYKGYEIVSQPDDQSGQYRVSGWIRKQGDAGEILEHRFERSDMLPAREACDTMMVSKAQRYIDEVGEAMFAPDPRRAGDQVD